MRSYTLITLIFLFLLATRSTYSQSNVHHPEFSQNEYTAEISEDAGFGAVVLNTILATDNDGHAVSYSIEGQSHNFFNLDSNTGVLTLVQTLDRESLAFVKFFVVAIDDGTSPQTSTAIVAITITDVNDNKPEFTTFPDPITISEDTATSSVSEIATFVAEDSDTGDNAQIEYSVSPTDRFSIGSQDGKLYLSALQLDFEVEAQFNLLIIATDKGSPALFRQKGLTILVANVDDTPPEFQNLPYSVTTAEDTAAGTTIFTGISAIDQDSIINNPITFTIQSGDDQTRFSITSSGDLMVADILDFETKTSHSLVIHAQEVTTTNPSQQTATASITIQITDVNDNSPDLPSTVLATVSESIEISHSVKQLEFTDADSVDSSYVFTVTTAGAKFTVDNTGLITIASTLDYETLTSEMFDVEMCEATLPALCDTTTVQVTVTDENDNSPVFSATDFSFTIVEEQMNPNFLTITATDADSGIFGDVVYSLDGTESSSFSVVATTGVISNIAPLDREANEIIDLVFIATDTDPDFPRENSVPLIITLSDINDQTPEFLSIPTPCAFDVPEGSSEDIFTFTVSDGDLLANAATSVTVDNTDFRVDPLGPEFTLKTSGVLDRETTPSYTIVLTATDAGTVPLASMITCTVTVTDINDETPVFGAPQSVTIAEDLAVASAVDTIVATDADIGANARLTYEFNSGNDDGVFVIDSATGAITLQNTLDFESTQSYTLEIIALDAADPPLVGTGTVTVTITDVNDNTPTFGLIRYEFTLTELAGLASVVGTVSAADLDVDSPNNVFNFAITSGNTLTTFELSTVTPGEILVLDPPLFDMTPEFILTLTVTDGGTNPSSLASTVIVEITITDTNNNPPVLVGTPYLFTVTEGTHVNTPVGFVSATDVDSDDVTFFIYSLPSPAGPFAIDQTGVIVTTSNTIDRETDTSFTFTVQVADNSVSPNQAMESVTITVVDVNDNNPVFSPATYTFTAVPENSGANQPVGTVAATDLDDGINAQISYAIIGGNQLGYFQIDGTSGAITTTGTTIDFEVTDSVTITVEARDAGLVQRATDVEVVIPIGDLNDNPPSFLGLPYSTSVSEDLVVGTTVFTIIKQDADSTLVVTLTIIAGNTGSAFRTDGMDIIILNGLDREITSSYTLTLQLDDGVAQETTTLPITIIDFNDNPPVLDASNIGSFTFAEDRTPAVITTVGATDIDEGVNQNLHFDIDDTHGIFQLGQTDGVLTQVSFFDRETTEVYTLLISVTDGGLVPFTVIQTITITITDVNEFTPLFTSFLYREGIAEDQLVPHDFTSNTLATDGDAQLADNGKVLHSILSVVPFAFTGDFSINEDTGQLTLMNMLDYEAIQEAVINIQARDVPPSGTALTSTSSVIFTISDINDNPPIFVSSTHQLTIFENSASPATVGVFTATDEDSGVNAEITYSNSANMPTQFTYDATSGVLTQTATFDRENLPHANPVTFQVIATDNPGMSGTADVTLTILDQNDNAPVFALPSYAFSIDEDLVFDSSVGLVSATETNAGDNAANGVIQYIITHGGDGHFDIPDPTTGEIRNLLTFDREVENVFELTVAAYDQAVNPLSTFVAVTITILDINDNPPLFTLSSYQLTVVEGPATTDVISLIDIFATDIDSVGVDITYDIADVNFDATTTAGKLAEIKSALQIDFETNPSFNVEITAKDAATGGMTGTANLVITVLDVNDNPPVFDMTVTAYTFPESEPGGSILFTISATDADSTSNGEIVYTVTSGDDGRFAVQPDTGLVTTTDFPFDFESTTSYTVTFTATDKGTPAMTDTIDITITITDVNDNPPVYTTNPFLFVEDENDATLTFDISATDGDVTGTFSTISYSITSETEHDLFTIDTTSGIVSLLHEFDRESAGLEILLPSGMGLHQLVVQATDVDNPAFTATTHVEIRVIDSNDNFPDVDCGLTSLTVQEGVTPNPETISTLPATDADFAQIPFFSISGNFDGLGEEIFRIFQTGVLEVDGGDLNRELTPTYTLQIEVSDAGTPDLTTTCIITVIVEDSNDFPPVFPNNPLITIDEATPIDMEILTYIATDEDIGINADIVYTINSGDTDMKFSLGQVDGKLLVVDALDFETIPLYNLEILAIDKGSPPMTGTGFVSVTITDVNDNAPILVQTTTTSISEDIAHTTLVYTAMASDADSGVNQDIVFSISGGNFGIFAIDGTTGQLTIIDNTDIDREMTDQYVLTIVATDLGTPPLDNSLDLTITVNDVNDVIPMFVPANDMAIAIVEDTAAEMYIGQILLTFGGVDGDDVGPNSDYQFRIDAGDILDMFTLSLDGVLTRSDEIDREVTDDFRLTITIFDQGTPSLTSSIFLDIDVTDSNDNTPIFENSTYTFSVNEDEATTFSIGIVLAIDVDEGLNRQIAYAIPDSTQPFAVDSFSGDVTVSGPLDRETTDTYTFELEAYDAAIHPRTGTTTIIVNILDVNDNQPYFEIKNYAFELPEHYVLNTVYATIVGIDADLPPNDVLYYHLETGNDTFAVGLADGKISLVRDLDRENSSDAFVNCSILVSNTMTFPVLPFDFFFSRTEISTTLSDINDNAPIFSRPWYRQGVLYDIEFDSVVTAVFATDLDLVNDTYFGGLIMFLLDTSVPYPSEFRVATNGAIHVAEDVTSKVGDHFEMIVIAYDNLLLDPHHNVTARVTLWVLTIDLQIVITIETPKPEVVAMKDDLITILENITSSLINIDQIVYNPINIEHTDVYFHAVDGDSLAILSRTSVIKVVDENRISVDSLFRDIEVAGVREASSPVVSLDPFLLVLSIVLAVLVLICCCLLILCVIYDQVRRKQIKHRQRVSLLKSYDASLDYNQSMSGQTYENPLWLHPYEQWEKEDEFTKGNPMFYESQEFVMDMFRESDDEKSEETISFGSWGQSKTKLRGRIGRKAASGASTITRMSDVDQDYNVELLAEVLGDDLPPSEAEPSEISNI